MQSQILLKLIEHFRREIRYKEEPDGKLRTEKYENLHKNSLDGLDLKTEAAEERAVRLKGPADAVQSGRSRGGSVVRRLEK